MTDAAPDPRLAAVRALNRVLPGNGEGASLREVLRAQPLEGAAGGLMRDLCFGVCRHLRPLNHWLNQQLSKPLKPSVQPVRLALLCGLYELWFSERASHAVVNAYPDLCRQLNAGWASGLANAVLRKASRTQAATAFADYPEPVRWSLPDWLWKQWQADWPEQAAAMAQASLAPPPMTLRINRRHHDRDYWLARLEGQPRAGALSPWSLYLEPPRPVSALPGFADGALSVQDEAAQLPVALISAPSDARILDACAAPGGKTGQLAEAFPDAHLVALDVSAPRLRQVSDTLQRLGATATVLSGDAADPSGWWDGELFDAIVLDAPCSATGILRRQPDVKWHRRRQDLPVLVDLQARMLDALWPLLRPGGTLVYATCSVLRAENDQQVSAFLTRTPDATEDTPVFAGENPAARGWQLLPREQGPDGFYLARLRKNTMG